MIKKRNLDPTLIQWIMSTTGIGPGIGDIRFLVPVVSTTSLFRSWLNDMRVASDHIHSDPQDAHDACKAYRNDVVVALPGVYDVNLTDHGEDGILWDNPNTHLIAAYPPTVYNGQVRIASQGTTGVDVTMTITAKECCFFGFNVTNSHSAADNAAVELGSTDAVTNNNFFKNVQIQGGIGASALSDAGSCSLLLKSCGNSLFEDCQIGHTISLRTAANAAITFALGKTSWCSQGNVFRGCRIVGWSNTAGAFLVKTDGANCADRVNEFDNCYFFNFDNGGGNPSAALHLPAGDPTGYVIALRGCGQSGNTAWLSATSVATNLVADMVAPGATGGTMITLT